MRNIDRIAIQERGIPGMTLMERAGEAVANLILGSIYPRCVAVVTGKGNNAGDGFIVARLLRRAGCMVRLLMLAPPPELSGDALSVFHTLPQELDRILCSSGDEVALHLAGADCIVDAILGTGVCGELRGIHADAVSAINNSGLTTVAVDIPSGLPSDAEYFDGHCVHADYTVTMGLPKLGMMQHPAAAFCGEVSIASLGFPGDLLKNPGPSRLTLVTPGGAWRILPHRAQAGHKGTFGSVLIVAGSKGMTGAAALSCMAAARSGAGLVFAAIPEDLNPILEVKLTEPITLPIPTKNHGIPDMAMLDPILAKAESCTAVAVGPGLGNHPSTGELVRELILHLNKPLVLDADGLNAIIQDPDILTKRPAPTIVTPHPGELERLTGIPAKEINRGRITAARRFADRFGVTVILKGAGTVIADPEGEVHISALSNTALSKGGSGDVLTGLVAGFLAQNPVPVSAAVLGVFIHGEAARIIAARKTEWAALPSDLIEAVPEAFNLLLNSFQIKRRTP